MEVESRYRERTISEHQRIEEHHAKLDLDNVPEPKNLEELVKILRDVFASDVVNVDYVVKLMQNYKSNPKDWRHYAKYDPHK